MPEWVLLTLLVYNTCKKGKKELLPPYDSLEHTSYSKFECVFKVPWPLNVLDVVQTTYLFGIKTTVPGVGAVVVVVSCTICIGHTKPILYWHFRLSDRFVDFAVAAAFYFISSKNLHQNSLIYFDFEEFCTGQSCCCVCDWLILLKWQKPQKVTFRKSQVHNCF